tara:strand:- start:4897 stop:5112 length:216 start_codon:yes stop_codon:yes gene_type:complete
MPGPLVGLAARKAARKAAKETAKMLGGIGLGTAGLYGASEVIGRDIEKKARKKLMKEGGSAARKFKERYGK